MTLVASIACIPVAAHGDADAQVAATNAAVAEAVEVRDAVEAVNAEALAEAPLAHGSRCDATMDVPGIGDACRTPDGMLRVELADGSSTTIHGADAPPITSADGSADAFAPGSTARVTAAGAADITCTDQTQKHYTLVYARPADVGSRYDTIAPKLRAEAYKMSAFLDAESQAVDPSKGQHLPFRCEGGAPVVLNATVPSLGGSGAVFRDVVEQLKALGYAYNDQAATERYMVYFDAPSATGAAGTGHVFTSDSRASGDNQNNKGGLYAVQYRFAQGGDAPSWSVLLHEVGHTMGAVVDSAPHATGGGNGTGGHCNDGLDVMCYDDGAPRSDYNASVCATKVFDCNRDDYFNPSPASGSYLASNWNVAAAYNAWLEHREAGDRSAPTTVTGLVQTGASDSAIGVSWGAASDDVAVTDYTVQVRTPGGEWRTATTVSRTSASVTGLSANTGYEIAVQARDAAGNTGEAGTLQAATNSTPDTTAPSAPVAGAPKITPTAVTISWRDASDDIGVADYTVRRYDPIAGSATRRAPRGAAQVTPKTTLTVPTSGLVKGLSYQFQVVARDGAGNASPAATITVRIAGDKMKPTAPRVRVTARTSSYVMLGWKASTDNVGVVRYRVQKKSGSRWVSLPGGTLAANTVRLRLRMPRGLTAVIRLAAQDAAGNTSYSHGVSVRTR